MSFRESSCRLPGGPGQDRGLIGITNFMHLHLTLPESLVDVPAFAGSPFAAGHAVTGADSTTEEASTSQAADDDDDNDTSTAATIFNVGILLLIPLGMYFLLIRPNKKRRQAAQELQRSIQVGDEVLLTSGVYGFITAMEDTSDVVWVEIDDDVQIRVTRAAISGKVSTSDTTPATDDVDDDDVSADDAVDADAVDELSDEAPAPAAAKATKASKASKASKAAKAGSKPAPARPSLKGTSGAGTDRAESGDE